MFGLQSSHRIAVPLPSDDPRKTPVGQLHETELRAPSRDLSSRVASPRNQARGQRPGSVESPALAEQEFREAIQDYQETSGRMFPTWSEVLEVLRSLGYRKLSEENIPSTPLD